MMGHTSTGGPRYDVKANAERIALIDDWIERRQALRHVPQQYASQVGAHVGQLFRARVLLRQEQGHG